MRGREGWRWRHVGEDGVGDGACVCVCVGEDEGGGVTAHYNHSTDKNNCEDEGCVYCYGVAYERYLVFPKQQDWQ